MKLYVLLLVVCIASGLSIRASEKDEISKGDSPRTDLNPFADSLAGNTQYLVSSKDSVFTLKLPKKYNNPNQTFEAPAIEFGAAVLAVNFTNTPDTLNVHITLKPRGEDRVFKIFVKESGNTVFETGFLQLDIAFSLLSHSSIINVLDTVRTKILTGTPTKWKFINETDNNREVENFISNTIGVFEDKTVVNTDWVNNLHDSVQVFHVMIQNMWTGTTVNTFFLVNRAPTSTSSENSGALKSFEISQNYPNPFNPTTTINYILPFAGNISINVYNILGERVTKLVDNYQTAGSHKVSWNAGKLASGVYICHLMFGKYNAAIKMLLIK